VQARQRLREATYTTGRSGPPHRPRPPASDRGARAPSRHTPYAAVHRRRAPRSPEPTGSRPAAAREPELLTRTHPRPPIAGPPAAQPVACPVRAPPSGALRRAGGQRAPAPHNAPQNRKPPAKAQAASARQPVTAAGANGTHSAALASKVHHTYGLTGMPSEWVRPSQRSASGKWK
jgi:hypothetical protein